MADPTLIAKTGAYRGSEPPKTARGLGILVTVAVLFLVAVGIAYGGIVLYRRSLAERLIGLSRELGQQEEKLDPKDINEIARVDKGLATARSLLSRHVHVSQFFRLLEQNVLPSVYFESFTHAFSSEAAQITGVADGFVSLDRQIEQFQSRSLIKSVALKDASIAEDGSIHFSLMLDPDPNLFRAP